MTYLIFRAPSDSAGRQWMEAIEVSFRTSNILARASISGAAGGSREREEGGYYLGHHSQEDGSPPLSLNESEIEKHFEDHDLDDEDEFYTDQEDSQALQSDRHHHGHDPDTDSDATSVQELMMQRKDSRYSDGGRRKSATREQDEPVIETLYIESPPDTDADNQDDLQVPAQSEQEQHRRLDLTKGSLPMSIFEPRSLLEKLSDYYYHCDLLAPAAADDDPFSRMKSVVRWYFSGIYKKPRGKRQRQAIFRIFN